MSSLDALAGCDTANVGGAGLRWTPVESSSVGEGAGGGEDDGGDGEGKDELFAIPPRERGPEMARSPFSLVSEEVVPWR
jgi:hypothetical protein